MTFSKKHHAHVTLYRIYTRVTTLKSFRYRELFKFDPSNLLKLREKKKTKKKHDRKERKKQNKSLDDYLKKEGKKGRSEIEKQILG